MAKTVEKVGEQVTEEATVAERAAELKARLEENSTAIGDVLPRNVDVQRFNSIVYNACRNNPALFGCEWQSVVNSAIQVAQLGLTPDPVLGQAFLIPFNDTRNGVVLAQLVLGYRGMLQLAYRSKRVRTCEARAVHESDDFDWRYGSDSYLRHTPDLDRPRDAEAIAFYAIAELSNGEVFHVLSRADAEERRDQSAGYKFRRYSSPWHTNFDAMACKTAIRDVFKYLPISVDLDRAVQLDERGENGVLQQFDRPAELGGGEIATGATGVAAAARSKADELSEKINKRRAAKQAEKGAAAPPQEEGSMTSQALDTADGEGDPGPSAEAEASPERDSSTHQPTDAECAAASMATRGDKQKLYAKIGAIKPKATSKEREAARSALLALHGLGSSNEMTVDHWTQMMEEVDGWTDLDVICPAMSARLAMGVDVLSGLVGDEAAAEIATGLLKIANVAKFEQVQTSEFTAVYGMLRRHVVDARANSEANNGEASAS